MTPRRSSDAVFVLNRLLAEERELLSRYVENSHRALTEKLKCHFDDAALFWGELPPPPPPPPAAPHGRSGETGEHLAQLETCGRVEEPNADSSFPEVGLDSRLQTVPSQIGVKDATKYDFAWNDFILTGACPATALGEATLKDCGSKVEEAVEPRPEGVLNGGNNGCPPAVRSVESDHDANSVVVQKSTTSPKVAGSTTASSIRTSHTLEESRAKRILTHPAFEIAFACLTLINAVAMGLEQQFVGFDTGYRLQAPGYTRTASETWPNAQTQFLIVENLFGIIFTLEVLFKAAVFRCSFFKSWWNLYDSIIITLWFVQNLSVLGVEMQSPLHMRLVKLGRLLRLLRLVKAFAVFDVLHLLVKSLEACMTALLWSVMFLIIIMLGTCIVMMDLMQEHLTNESIPLDQRLLLFRYFGNFSNSLFSMYELTMGNWVPIGRCVVDNVGDSYMMFFVVYRMLVGFAVVKVITAIFTAETFRVASSDDEIMMLHKERQIAMHTRRMEQLLIEGDASHDGLLSLEEFEDLLLDPRVQKWLAAQDIEVRNVALAFNMIDVSGDGQVSAEELVRGFAGLKGAARSMDMASIGHAFMRFEGIMDRIEQSLPPPSPKKSFG
eukprot:TRINITY_DN20221_c0_g1_i1.p1 TRINITY_DN20221_c0_g1~~TRINITY_DN20221_c0_g1_i1.p1  ORF type:complete len:610 (-),score=81.83 TRINITY_DN20221_c0_g1_i1:135-1964(-)